MYIIIHTWFTMVNELIKIIVLIYLVYLHMRYTQSFTHLVISPSGREEIAS